MAGRISACVLGAFLLSCSGILVAQQPPAPSVYGQVSAGHTAGVYDSYAAPPVFGGPSPSSDIGFTTNPTDPAFDYDDNSPLDRVLRSAFRNSWIRAEYLQWDIENPGKHALGEPVALEADPTEHFDYDPLDFIMDPYDHVSVRIPTLNPISLKDNNGVRMTAGLNTTFGTFEASWFDLEESGSAFRAMELPSPPTDLLIPVPPILPIPLPPNRQPFQMRWILAGTLLNGQVVDINDHPYFYNESFAVRMKSNFEGAEIIFVRGPKRNVRGLTWQPLVGFQYRRLDEDLYQTGVTVDKPLFWFPGPNPLPSNPRVTTIDSSTENKIYSPEIGLRTEIENKWFKLGVEPKIGLGVNKYRGSVTASQFRSNTDPTVYTSEDGSRLMPTFELKAYARLNVSDSIALYAAYNLFYAGKVTRPYDNIRYNDNPVSPTADVTQHTNFQQFRVQGLSVGGEIKLP